MKNSHGWIYFLRGPGGLVKIGKTKREPTQRIAEYSPLLPFTTELILSIPVTDLNQCERLFHSIHTANRVRGEWFNFSDEELNALVSYWEEKNANNGFEM
jgi:hypothetical protein